MKKAERDVATTTAEMVKPAKRAAAKAPAQKVEEERRKLTAYRQQLQIVQQRLQEIERHSSN